MVLPKDGSVRPDGIQLTVITNMDAEVRHLHAGKSIRSVVFY